ncbi:MAG TPA: hypothetical protein DCG19_06180 [Cryomorphaceae bacterium]|nr:hypothetical protein [Owenweeksia sp.]HAD96975.1 hypothetical protein [Cryomorphaceae bacterium]HBF18889.1 hypothetical protein [Cryomorphaceae bacterium]|tara:strand:+ start:390 stop:614 length:225 start_codon:yes stop_codon:yes gene_type:complete
MNKGNNNRAIQIYSVITCPVCGFVKEERMPEDACQYFYECTNCGELLKPRKGDCCVYCSYGSVPCPSIQLSQDF